MAVERLNIDHGTLPPAAELPGISRFPDTRFSNGWIVVATDIYGKLWRIDMRLGKARPIRFD